MLWSSAVNSWNSGVTEISSKGMVSSDDVHWCIMLCCFGADISKRIWVAWSNPTNCCQQMVPETSSLLWCIVSKMFRSDSDTEVRHIQLLSWVPDTHTLHALGFVQDWTQGAREVTIVAIDCPKLVRFATRTLGNHICAHASCCNQHKLSWKALASMCHLPALVGCCEGVWCCAGGRATVQSGLL